MDNIIKKAKALSLAAHEGQLDKIGEPYFAHPESVAMIVTLLPSFHNLNTQEKIDAVAVAFLHDVVEDTDYTFDSLKGQGFSDEVVEAVRLLTKTENTVITSYYSELAKNPVARAVKSADIIHNSLASRRDRLDQATQERLEAKYRTAAYMVIQEADLDFYDRSRTS